jgi:Family of unknown function (DUF6868)
MPIEPLTTMEALTAFFMWCSVINGGLLILSSIFIMTASDLTFATHGKWFKVSRETFDTAMYSFLGLYKLAFLVFNIVPYLALLIIG